MGRVAGRAAAPRLSGVEAAVNRARRRARHNAAVPRLQVLLAALCFGTTGTAQALGPDGASPLTVGAVRVALGAALLLLAVRLAADRLTPAQRSLC